VGSKEGVHVSDRVFVVVVLVLGAIGLVCVCGAIVLSFHRDPIPAELAGIAGSCIGAIVGLLARNSRDK